MVIFGGTDSTHDVRNDTWALTWSEPTAASPPAMVARAQAPATATRFVVSAPRPDGVRADTVGLHRTLDRSGANRRQIDAQLLAGLGSLDEMIATMIRQAMGKGQFVIHIPAAWITFDPNLPRRIASQ